MAQRIMLMIIAPVRWKLDPSAIRGRATEHAISGRALVVDDDVGAVDQLLAGGVRGLGLFAVGFRDDRDYRQSALLRAHGHLDDDGADTAGGNHEKASCSIRNEIRAESVPRSLRNFPGKVGRAGRWRQRCWRDWRARVRPGPRSPGSSLAAGSFPRTALREWPLPKRKTRPP